MKNTFVLSIGFPQYIKDKSGTSKVIMAHQKMFNEAGISYVHLFAVKKLVFKDKVTLFSYFGMYIDGKYEGIFTANQVLKRFERWFANGIKLSNIHIHHFMYMKLRNIDTILSGLPEAAIKVFLHDYYLCCTNYNLMRNREKFCGGLGLVEKNCSGCYAFEKSKIEEEKIHFLLHKYKNRIVFIAPSEVTKNIYLRFHREYKGQVKVIPHQKLIGEYRGNLKNIECGEKMKIGFPAMPRKHKGWDTWLKINNLFSEYYDFIVLNSSEEIYEGMKKVKVEFTENNMDAMTSAIRENNIQLIFLWSLCPETYSYTCFESYAANAYILTNEISGNIAGVVKNKKNGCVFSSEEELFSFLSEPSKIKEKLNNYRSKEHYGPLYLEENDEIVRMTKSEKMTDIVMRHKEYFANRLLMETLNILLKYGRI